MLINGKANYFFGFGIGSVIYETDPRIRIRIKMKWIRNAGCPDMPKMAEIGIRWTGGIIYFIGIVVFMNHRVIKSEQKKPKNFNWFIVKQLFIEQNA